MESGNQGGGYPNFGKSRKHPLVPPPMTAIGRFLQGQSSQSHSSHHNFEINKEQFIPSNGVYGFSSSSNEGISGMYNKYEVPSAHCLPMDKMFAADHGIYSRSYRNMHLNNEVIKSCTEIKSKGGSGKSLIKGQWTDEEDKKLLRLVKLHGERKWAHIAQQMIGKAGKQCRERWHNHLCLDIKKDTWSEDEERILVEVHRKVGNKWAEIAKLIPGRTDNSIKNRWNATKRRQISRRKSKQNEAKNKKLRCSILHEYIISTTTNNVRDAYNIASKTSTTTSTIPTLNATRGSSPTRSLGDTSINFSIIFPELANSNSDGLQSVGSVYGPSSNGEKGMDLVEMAFSSQFSLDFDGSTDQHCGKLESIDPSKQIAIIEHYLYILGHLESIDPSICISWKLSSSALEMLVPGHVVGNVMGRDIEGTQAKGCSAT
ncbi:transcription factor MYB119-like protein [Tanacetum coccineum]|uniref:Transcription factor MYB119-like protein n=1 Tax=Tanacetum coccineum TaxID=301880 RepID=A0ABQ5E988_9ASTR